MSERFGVGPFGLSATSNSWHDTMNSIGGILKSKTHSAKLEMQHPEIETLNPKTLNPHPKTGIKMVDKDLGLTA